jgi:hypothetical protein
MADIRDFIEALRDQAAGLKDAAATVGTGIVLAPFKGLYGLGKLATSGDVGEAAKAIEDTHGTGETPQTEEGRQYLENLGEGMHKVGELARPITVPYEAWAIKHPALAAGGEAAASLIPIGRTREALVQGAKSAVEAARPLAREAVLAAALRQDAPELSGVTRRAKAPAAARVRTREEPDELPTVPTLRQTLEAAARERDPQLALPGLEPTLVERSQNAERTLQGAQARARAESRRMESPAGTRARDSDLPYSATFEPPLPEVTPETQSALADALRAERQANYDEMRAHVDDLRRARHPDETLEDALDREYQVLSGKHTLAELAPQLDRPHAEFVDAITAPDVQQTKVNRLNDAQRFMARAEEEAAYRPTPDWVTQLTTDPRYQRAMPRGVAEPLDTGRSPGASQRWWENQFPPPDPRDTVKAFLREIRSQPAAFQYGAEPPAHVRSLEDFARHFGEQSGTPIDVEWTDAEPSFYETEKTHGRGEIMRDQYGDYKEKPKEHERGDVPMYDEYGAVKKTKEGLDEEGNPVLVKREAEGGEPKRDRYGDQQYRFIKSQGGEVVRDERGRPKMEEVEDYDAEPQGSGFTLTARDPKTGRTGYIETVDWPEDPTTTATQAQGHGALLYQTMFGHAAREGIDLPNQTNLSAANQLRLLSNALATDARMGRNPRGLLGTSSGDRPPAQKRGDRLPAEGPEIWRALTGEAEHRLKTYAPKAPPIEFTPEGFTAGGEPIAAPDIRKNLRTYSPHFDADPWDARERRGQVTQKTLMQSALYRWLEQASPEEAKKVASSWAKYGAPLFGLGGIGLLADQMRQDAPETD